MHGTRVHAKFVVVQVFAPSPQRGEGWDEGRSLHTRQSESTISNSDYSRGLQPSPAPRTYRTEAFPLPSRARACRIQKCFLVIVNLACRSIVFRRRADVHVLRATVEVRKTDGLCRHGLEKGIFCVLLSRFVRGIADRIDIERLKRCFECL
jgi:hypothetical protein